MKRIFIVALAISFFQCKEVTIAQSNDNAIASEIIKPETKTTDAAVAKILNFLASDDLKGRDTGSEGLDKAATFIEDEFKTYGLAPYFETYRDSFDAKGVATYNVVGYLKGTDSILAQEFVVIGAHFDHIGKAEAVGGDVIANGANDNAAGTAAVISLAKYFAHAKSNKRSVLFVLFGAEEKGLLGSKHLAEVLKKKNVDLYTMVNFEMIGVPMNNKSHKAYLTGFEKSNMADKINEYAGTELIGFLEKAKEYQLFQRSDNYPFYKQFGVPCQTISTFDFTNYDYYHHVDDEASEMNFDFMAELINDCVPVLSKIFNTPTKEIQIIAK